MDLRDINELGFACFGQLLDQKADFRILRCEGILNSFSQESLEKIFQLPYGLDINPEKEYLSFVKVAAQSGKYGDTEYYIFITSYKFAGIDINKRKNYYGGCLAYKYSGYVITGNDALHYLSMVLDLSKSLILGNGNLPLQLQSFKGVKKELYFAKLSAHNNYVIPVSYVNDELNIKFIDYNYDHSNELSPMHKFILASGSSRIQGINTYEIKIIETGFDQVVNKNINLFAEKEIKFKEAGQAENNRIMVENKNDNRIDEAMNARLKPVFEKLDSIEQKLSESKNQSAKIMFKSVDKVYLSLIILLLVVLFFILREVVAINIITKPAEQQVDAKTVQDIEKLVSKRIDSLKLASREQAVIYVASKNDNISKIAEMYKVSPDMIVNKNSAVKAGDTLIIRK